MRYTEILPLMALARQAAAVVFTQTLVGGTCWANVWGPSQTLTIPGATTAIADPAGTLTLTQEDTILPVPGDTTYTYTSFPTPPPRLARRQNHGHDSKELTTIVEVDECKTTTTLTLFSTITYSDPAVTTTATSYGHMVTTTIYTTEVCCG